MCAFVTVDKYLYDFKFGAVDKRPAEALGYTLAKVHVCAPSRWDKSSLLDETLLHFIANGHYKRVADDTQTYLRHTEFASSEVQSQFYISVDPEIALKHSKTLRKRSPELIRAMDRHLDNFLNPPTETATFTHLDTHLINVLVYSNAPTYDCAVDDPEYDPGALGVMKLIDMEFSNWGPAGGDCEFNVDFQQPNINPACCSSNHLFISNSVFALTHSGSLHRKRLFLCPYSLSQ